MHTPTIIERMKKAWMNSMYSMQLDLKWNAPHFKPIVRRSRNKCFSLTCIVKCVAWIYGILFGKFKQIDIGFWNGLIYLCTMLFLLWLLLHFMKSNPMQSSIWRSELNGKEMFSVHFECNYILIFLLFHFFFLFFSSHRVLKWTM